jgi:tRNA-dihydrouridine synthase C
MSRLILAPMEGLADDILRGALTRAGRYDWGVTEFVRGTGTLLPRHSFSRVCPELLHRIAAAVRAAVPRGLTVSTKMRLGIDDTARALDCARALEAGGAQELVVHARTRSDGYRPQVRWEWVARIRAAVALPVIANGEVWDVAGWHAIRAATGCSDVMLGRGAVADPFLVERIRGTREEHPCDPDWLALQPLIADCWSQVLEKLEPRHAPGRLEQWLGLLRRNYAGAEALYRRVRELNAVGDIGAALARQTFPRACAGHALRQTDMPLSANEISAVQP